MRARDRRPSESFGFARSAATDQARLPAPAETTPTRPAEHEPARSSTSPVEENWVVRSKADKMTLDVDTPRAKRLRAKHLKAKDIAGSTFVGRDVAAPSPPPQSENRSKRWLALGLVSMVYVVGMAGLWSMYQTFEQPKPLSLTPAGDSVTQPPLEKSTDMRDALLDDGLFRPKFKPDIITDTEKDVAGADLQKRS